MKKNLILIAILIAFAFVVNAQHETMFIMKDGQAVGQYNVYTEIDSIIFYEPSNAGVTKGTFTDTRDNTVYKWVAIGNQVWMAENLRYLPRVAKGETGSTTESYYYVYGYDGTDVDEAKNTDSYKHFGAHYNWPAAMNGASSSEANPSKVQGVCPTGWHLPSKVELEELNNFLADNGYNYDGSIGGGYDKIAKAMAGLATWNSATVEGAIGNLDYYESQNKSGFTALPGGYRNSDGNFYLRRHGGYLWTTTEDSEDSENARFMILTRDSSGSRIQARSKAWAYNVRCVRD